MDETSLDIPSEGVVDTTNPLDDLPPEMAGIVREFTRSASVSLGVGTAINPILEKLNASHISAVIAGIGQGITQEFQDRRHARLTNWIFVTLLLFALGGLCIGLVMLRETTLAREILLGAGGFVGGLGAGYGLRFYQQRH